MAAALPEIAVCVPGDTSLVVCHRFDAQFGGVDDAEQVLQPELSAVLFGDSRQLIAVPGPPSPRGCRSDAGRAGTPAGVFGAELRFCRTRAGLSRKDLAARATVSHDVISKIETGERPPAGDFPPRLDAVPGLDARGALTRLRDHLKKGHKQRLYGWFQQWAGIEAQATVLRWYEPLVVPGLLQTEEYARASRDLIRKVAEKRWT